MTTLQVDETRKLVQVVNWGWFKWIVFPENTFQIKSLKIFLKIF